jgi:acetyl-CoA C-acetyltransferase
MSSNPVVIVYAGRTAIGKFSGMFASTPAPQLGATLVKDCIKKTGIKPEKIDEIIMGQVLTAGVGQAPARQTAIYGGLPKSVCATTVNRVCGSGLKAVMMADQAIRAGDAKIVLAGGQENMTLAPHLLPNSRAGLRFGNAELKDHMQFDGLWDPYGNTAMGNCGEECAKKYSFSREDQDEFAMGSYQKARTAVTNKIFENEIVAVELVGKKGTTLITQDEEPFGADLAKLKDLRPAFDKNGTITAANASSISDGAALLMITDLETAKKEGLTPIAKIVAQASYAHEPNWFTTAPVACIEKVLKKANLTTSDIDLYEINEAFAVVTMAAIHDLKLPNDRVNIYGGAVALGHPIGASGARVLVTLLTGLKERHKKRGLATLCIGGGEASAVIVEMI